MKLRKKTHRPLIYFLEWKLHMKIEGQVALCRGEENCGKSETRMT